MATLLALAAQDKTDEAKDKEAKTGEAKDKEAKAEVKDTKADEKAKTEKKEETKATTTQPQKVVVKTGTSPYVIALPVFLVVLVYMVYRMMSKPKS